VPESPASSRSCWTSRGQRQVDARGQVWYVLLVRMAKRVKVPISSARSDLFKLAELVRQSRDATVVVLEGRGGIEPVALVREARLAYLEERVAQMDTNTAQPFSLAGSLASGVDDATLAASLLELRRAWSTSAEPEPPGPPQRVSAKPRPRR
jgi:hypothetical protein